MRTFSHFVTFGSHPDQAEGQCASRELDCTDSRGTREIWRRVMMAAGSDVLSVHNVVVLPCWTQDSPQCVSKFDDRNTVRLLNCLM